MARHKSKDMETILAVYSTKDAESASLALLKADVECVRRKIGAGKYGNFLLSLNNYGEENCVDPRDKEKASQIIEEWRKQKTLRQNQEAAQTPAETAASENSRENNVLWARILAGVALAVIVVFYILQRY